MAVETDDNGRLYLSAAQREKYGEKFHVVEYEDRLELTPIDDNPLQAVREAAGDAFDGKSAEDLRIKAREQARADAEAGFQRGKDSTSSEGNDPPAETDE
jgi:hypothetical protein